MLIIRVTSLQIFLRNIFNLILDQVFHLALKRLILTLVLLVNNNYSLAEQKLIKFRAYFVLEIIFDLELCLLKWL